MARSKPAAKKPAAALAPQLAAVRDCILAWDYESLALPSSLEAGAAAVVRHPARSPLTGVHETRAFTHSPECAVAQSPATSHPQPAPQAKHATLVSAGVC